MHFVASLAAGLGVILSAETLAILGRGLGEGGAWFLLSLLASVGLHLPGALALFGDLADHGGEGLLLRRGLGRTAAFVFPLSARVTVTLVAATGLFATAGFVFNEVFLYWFPNFLFAFILLGLVLAVNLAGRRIWGLFQGLAALAVLVGLGVLVIAGISSSPPPAAAPPGPWDAVMGMGTPFLAALVPVGYDLAFFAVPESSREIRRSPATAVLLGGLVAVLWGFVSLRWVPRATLAVTTIPYTVAARAIMGQRGRITMGIVILAGVFGAVNALYAGVSRMLTAMGAAGLVPSFPGENGLQGRLYVLLLAAATAGMLLSGMAGSSHLAAYLRGGLILWLIHYGVLHLAAFVSDRRNPVPRLSRMVHAAAGLALGLAALALLVGDSERTVVAAFMFGVVGAALILGLLWTGLTRNRVSGP